MRVLVVDDDDDTRMVLTLGLARLGFDVVEASSVMDAVRVLSDTSVVAVLTDWHIADGSAEAIVEAAGARRVVILSGDERLAWKEWPAHVCLQRKPVSLHRIAEALRGV